LLVLVGQGRIRIGHATLRAGAADPAETAGLEIHVLDRALTELAAVQGSGSERRRRDHLHSLLSRSTAPEQQFLAGLLLGEIRRAPQVSCRSSRQGVWHSTPRRAVMMAGDIACVARSALESGAAGLDSYDIQLFRPIQPMLAQPSEDVVGALADLGEAALEYKMDGAQRNVRSLRALNASAAVPEIVEAVCPSRPRLISTANSEPHSGPSATLPGHRPASTQADLDTPNCLSPFWFGLLCLDGQSLRRAVAAFSTAGLRRPASFRTRVLPIPIARRFLQALEHGTKASWRRRRSPYAADRQSWLRSSAHTRRLAFCRGMGRGRRVLVIFSARATRKNFGMLRKPSKPHLRCRLN
jgi:DNA ligase-1